MEKLYENFLLKRRKNDLERRLLPVTPRNAREIMAEGKNFINFSGNDYLGLKSHPGLIERAREWVLLYGAGAGSSRLVSGNLDVFETIEKKTAALKKRQAALVLASGFQTNATLLPALFDRDVLGAEPLVFSDRLNHASIHLGCAAAEVRQIRYRHLDCDHLQSLMEKHCDGKRPAFIITESVFSMDGDVADLTRLSALAKKYNAMLVVDEAHATGVLGVQGAGLAAQYPDIDIVMGTFSKAMGSFGAYIACSNVMREYLINRCAGLIYSTALPPAVLGAIDAALDIVPQMDQERAYVQKLAQSFRGFLTEQGYTCGASSTQIVPMMMPDVQSCLALAQELKNKGALAVAIRAPTVPQNESRIRFSFSAAHTMNDLDFLTSALARRKAA